MPGLDGVRVLELGGPVAAPFATKMMADLGADVIKVEPRDGDPARWRGPFPPGADASPGRLPDLERSGLFLALNANKRSVVLDLETSADRARFDDLAAGADIVVHDLPPGRMAARGIDYARLAASRPALVLCSITPFGLSGPHRDYRAEEITLAHAGGWAWVSPGASVHRELPPLKAFGHQVHFQAGAAACAASLAAFHRAQRTGEGEHVDLAEQAYVASFIEAALVYWTYPGVLADRFGARGLNPWGIYECRDGLVFVVTPEEDQWKRLVELMGSPEWTSLEIFDGMKSRFHNADALRIFLQEWIADWKVDDLFHEGQKRRICFAPVLTMEGLAAQPQPRARGFFARVSHPRAGSFEVPGAPYVLRDPWWQVRQPPPLLGQHQQEVLAEAGSRAAAAPGSPAPARGLPLEGIRVVDLTWVWAGPFAAMHLAHLGAEVIKIESAERPDLGRRLSIYPRGMAPGLDRSAYFNQWNQGKKSLHLNLGHPDAAAVVKELVAESDVVIENFATGVMERLGLDYDSLVAVRPDLVMASISGFGQTGPWREYMAYGPAVSPLSGLSTLSGYAGEGPSEVGISLGDPAAGITAAAAVCAALVARERHGGGQHIDVSLWEATAVGVVEGWMAWVLQGAQPPRMGNRDPRMAPHNAYRCAGDDCWVTIACANDDEWRALARVVGGGLADDERFATEASRKQNEDALDARLAAWTAGLDRWEVTAMLQAVAVAAFPSMSPRDLDRDPHLAARGFFEELPHPEVGRRRHAGIPWRLTNGPNGVRTPAPCLGADTLPVLRDVLGYTSERIDALVRDGIVS